MSTFQKQIVILFSLILIFVVAFSFQYKEYLSLSDSMKVASADAEKSTVSVYQKTVDALFSLIEASALDPMYGPEPDALNDILLRLKKYPAIQSAHFIDAEENILADGTEIKESDSDSYINELVGQPMPIEKRLDTLKRMIVISGNQLLFNAPIISQGDTLGRFQAILSLSEINAIAENLSTQIINTQQESKQRIILIVFGSILGVVIGLILSVFIFYQINKALVTLTEVADNISKGDYDANINIHRSDEIGALANSFTTMKEGIKKKVQDLRDLNLISENLAVCTHQTTALEKTLQALSVHSNVKFGSVYLFNNNNKLELKTFYPPKKIEEQQKPREFEDGEGIIGITCKKKEIIYIPNTIDDERFVGKNEVQAKSIICVPLIDNHMTLGVLNLSGDIDEVKFEETDYEFAETIARQLVTTIKNIRMRETIEEQNRNLEAKVEERTAALRQKNNDIASMMENMHQGLFTITNGGLIHPEYASYLEEIFETDRIANRNFADLLFSTSIAGSDAIDQNVTAVDSIVGEDEMMYEFNSHCLMGEMVIRLSNDQEKILELDWDPIINEDGVVDKLMVTVRDVTELKALEAESKEQKQELEIIGEVLSVEASKFRDFIDTSHEFLAECLTIIETTSEKDANAIANLFRFMHTVKGNARTYGLKYITNIVHEVETTYDYLRKNEDAIWDSGLLLNELEAAKAIIGQYAYVFRDKLGLDKRAANDIILDPSRVHSWLTHIDKLTRGSNGDELQDVVSEAYSLLVTVEAKPIREVISGVINSANSLADQLEKAQPSIIIQDKGILINREVHSTLNNIFMHIFRNAMDHGIESTDERLARGKPAQGNITLNITLENDDYANISIQDDGRGLALRKIYEMALDKGIYDAEDAKPTDSDIAQLIFSSGFTTSDEITDVSGRGVGMDAVKGFLKDQGGSIDVILNGGNDGDDFRNFITHIRIPKSFYKVAFSFNNNVA